MEFKELAEERKRMCKAINGCEYCPVYEQRGARWCEKWMLNNPEEAEKIINKWAEEHPRRTYLSQLLERYPDAPIEEEGTPSIICPRHLGLKDIDNCEKGCVACWNQEADHE